MEQITVTKEYGVWIARVNGINTYYASNIKASEAVARLETYLASRLTTECICAVCSERWKEGEREKHAFGCPTEKGGLNLASVDKRLRMLTESVDLRMKRLEHQVRKLIVTVSQNGRD